MLLFSFGAYIFWYLEIAVCIFLSLSWCAYRVISHNLIAWRLVFLLCVFVFVSILSFLSAFYWRSLFAEAILIYQSQ